MRSLHIDDHVRLTEPMPELMLAKGAVGVVRSEWFSPATCFEVEFTSPGEPHATRALLQAGQLAFDEAEDAAALH